MLIAILMITFAARLHVNRNTYDYVLLWITVETAVVVLAVRAAIDCGIAVLIVCSVRTDFFFR